MDESNQEENKKKRPALPRNPENKAKKLGPRPTLQQQKTENTQLSTKTPENPKHFFRLSPVLFRPTPEKNKDVSSNASATSAKTANTSDDFEVRPPQEK